MTSCAVNHIGNALGGVVSNGFFKYDSALVIFLQCDFSTKHEVPAKQGREQTTLVMRWVMSNGFFQYDSALVILLQCDSSTKHEIPLQEHLT